MSRPLIAIAVAAVVLAGPATAAAQVEISLGLDRGLMGYRDFRDVGFTLEGVPEGTEPQVVLESDPWPFGSWRDERTLTREELFYGSLRVLPRRNTRYRLRYASSDPPVFSNVGRYDVYLPSGVVEDVFLSGSRYRFTFAVGAPQRVLHAYRLRLPVYFRRGSTGWATRVGFIRLRRDRLGARGRGTVGGVPHRVFWKGGDQVYVCLRERRDDGFGVFDRRQRACGRKRILVRY